MTTFSPKRIGLAAWETVRLFVGEVFVHPVREGRLRDIGWPAGLRPIVLVALVGYVVAVGLVLGSELIRQNIELTSQAGSGTPPLPRAVIWITFALTALSISLGTAGALHARGWVRWSVTTFTVLVLVLTTIPDFSWLARTYAILTSIGIIVLVAIRGRRRFAWWEFAVIAGLVFTTFAMSIGVVSAQALPLGFDFAPIVIALVLMTVGQLAIPAAMVAGASVAELAVSSAVWLANSFRERLGRIGVVVLLCIVVAWRIWDVAPSVVRIGVDPVSEGGSILSATVFLALIGASWMLLRRLRGGTGRPTTASLITTLAAVSLLIAAFLTLTIPGTVIQLAGLVIRAFGGPAEIEVFVTWVGSVSANLVVIGATRTAVGVGLIAIGIVLARRGRTVLPELLVAIGLSNATVGVGNVLGYSILWSPESLALVATALALGLTVWMLLRRTATLNRLTAVVGALLVAALFSHREFISDPLAIVLPSVVAVTLLGFVWSFFTGYAAANEDSPRYPRPARVLLVLANTVFATTVLAYTQLARDPGSSVDLPLFTQLGAQSFGDALIACALMSAFIAVVRDRELA